MNSVIRNIQRLNHVLIMATLVIGSFNANAASQHQTVNWQLPSTRFAELNLDPHKIAKIAQGGQLIIVSKPQDFTFWNARKKALQEYKSKRVTYVATVIDAPIDEIKAMAWDLESQAAYSPLLKKTKNLSTNGNIRIGSYRQSIQIPVIKLVSDFIVQFNKYDNGNIGMVLIDEGDVEALYQYWEFFPLDERRTLTVLSGWQDIETASFTYKLILEAEPSLKKVFPVLSLYERLTQFRDEAARRNHDYAEKPDPTIYDIRSVNSFISDNKALDVHTLKELTKLGSVQFYHKLRKLSHDDEIHDIIQVSAVSYIPLPQKTIQPLLNNFSSLVEYNDLTYGWLNNQETQKDWGHLHLAARIGPIHLPVEIYVSQEHVNENKMLFEAVDHAYMYPLMGHVEYLAVPAKDNEQGTLVSLTIGGVIGPEASFIFKMIRYVPFHNVLLAALYGMLTADNMENWVVERVANDIISKESVAPSPDKVVDTF
ncbi:MAG: hypothetical protein COB04_07690 [Gammaproteobacteria bacterium]|nr:MAG: hypothetical protein COB04_07690 [Gammaproteobacteria bacterium]